MIPERKRQLQELMKSQRLDAIALERCENHAAFLKIRSHNGFAPEPPGRVVILVFADDSTPPSIIANRTEASRIAGEESTALVAHPYCWAEPGEKRTILDSLTVGLRVGADVPGHVVELNDELVAFRSSLFPTEIETYRSLSRDCAAVLEDCARRLLPGVRELDAAAWLTSGLLELDILPALVLVASDERLAYRHAVPTEKSMTRHAQLSVTASRAGLFASLTRIVHFGPVPTELQLRQEAVALIDAQAIVWTRPGAVIGEVFARILETYNECGYASEWKEHHLGGATGFSGRELKASRDQTGLVRTNQAWAWNPTLGLGAKSEDTVLVTADGHEVMTRTPLWPAIELEVDGNPIERNGILMIE